MKTKAKKREKERVYNLAYSLVSPYQQIAPEFQWLLAIDLYLTYVPLSCRLAMALLGCPGLHTAVLSSAQHCFLIPALKITPIPHPQPPAGTCCSHGRKQVQDGKPIHDSTLKASTWTWAYILSRHSLLAQAV